MLRISVPYGLLESAQLRKMAHVVRKYDKGYAHFTTRQNIQLNWPKLEQVPDLLAELAEVQLHGIQACGNDTRNITSDYLAGVAADEHIDPRPYCELLRQYVDAAPGVLLAAAQVQVRLHRRRGGPGRHAHQRRGRAPGAARGRRDRLSLLRRRRPRPAADAGSGDEPVRAGVGPAALRVRGPAHLQPLRPPGQHPQGAHQDRAARMGHRALPRRDRGGVRQDQGQRRRRGAAAAAGGHRADARALHGRPPTCRPRRPAPTLPPSPRAMRALPPG